MRLLGAIFALLGAGCRHERISRVFREPEGRRRHYVLCLECGAEFEYSLATMRRGPKILRPPSHPDQVALERQWEREQRPGSLELSIERLTEPAGNRRAPDEPDKSGAF